MLILTRRIGEKLVIGDNVTITLLGIKGVQIRVGIEAPVSVAMHREEIYQRILKERVTDTVQAARTHTRMEASTALIAPTS